MWGLLHCIYCKQIDFFVFSFVITDRTGDTCGPYGLAGVKQAVLKHDKMTRAVLGDRYHNASFVSVHEDHIHYTERLKTFDDWSSDSKISKEALSEAGFIYRRMYPKSISTRNFSIINWLFAKQRKNDIKKTDEQPGNVLPLQYSIAGNSYFKKVAGK